MEINTIFDIGDTVWLIYENKAKSGVISKIRHIRYLSPVSFDIVDNELYCVEINGIEPGFQTENDFTAKRLFTSKEKLIKSLLQE